MKEYHAGLEGVVAARTRLSSVNGEAGELIIAGYPMGELAAHAEFEEVVYLLWNDRLPNSTELAKFKVELAKRRALPSITVDVLTEAARGQTSDMDALRMAVSTLSLSVGEDRQEQALTLVASIPTIVATYARLVDGRAPVNPRVDLGHAANFLYMLTGNVPDESRVRALNAYLVTVCDHGLNASTFAARVIIATESDMVSAVTGAVGALKGPLHGGAPGPALDMVFDIIASKAVGESVSTAAERAIRGKLASGERLMGFGHRIYKVRDPRADVLATASGDLYHGDDTGFYDAAREVEVVAMRLLEEHKPGRRLQTNVEFYTALLLHGVGISPSLFTPIFAMARSAGWTAHCLEQLANNRIYRPESEYLGETGRVWTDASTRPI